MIKRILCGALAGLVGGVVFGMMMGMMGMLPMVAKLVGSSSPALGFLIHMINSTIIGGAFGVVFGGASSTVGRGLGFGLLYGLIWWVLGPLMFMPLMLGMGLRLSVAGMSGALPSLWGHLVYGGLTGLAYWAIERKMAPAIEEVGAPESQKTF